MFDWLWDFEWCWLIGHKWASKTADADGLFWCWRKCCMGKAFLYGPVVD